MWYSGTFAISRSLFKLWNYQIIQACTALFTKEKGTLLSQGIVISRSSHFSCVIFVWVVIPLSVTTYRIQFALGDPSFVIIEVTPF